MAGLRGAAKFAASARQDIAAASAFARPAFTLIFHRRPILGSGSLTAPWRPPLADRHSPMRGMARGEFRLQTPAGKMARLGVWRCREPCWSGEPPAMHLSAMSSR